MSQEYYVWSTENHREGSSHLQNELSYSFFLKLCPWSDNSHKNNKLKNILRLFLSGVYVPISSTITADPVCIGFGLPCQLFSVSELRVSAGRSVLLQNSHIHSSHINIHRYDVYSKY